MRAFASRYWPFVAVIAGWQLWVTLGHLSSIVVPSPFAVLQDLATHPLLYLREGSITLGVALGGMFMGTLLSFTLGIATWFSPLLTSALTGPALFVQSTPIVALMPVLGRLFGYDWRTVVIATALIAFFPTFVLLASGLRSAPPGTSDVFAALGAKQPARLRYLALPSAVPNLLTAIRIAAANCILAALVAEYLMGTAGLGRLFASSESSFDVARAWGACLVATVISVGAYLSARRLERRVGRDFRA